VYRETTADGAVQRVVVSVTGRTRRIASGVTARVVHDQVTSGGQLVEDTFDWYAQDRRGNVWYEGEDTKEYEHGKVVSTAGSWEAGVGGAVAGIAMPARPRVGMRYRQEYLKGEAEDKAGVLGVWPRLLLTREWNPLERGSAEYKLYERGVGLVLATSVSGKGDREVLVSHRPGR
jgi:hypothetical protein